MSVFLLIFDALFKGEGGEGCYKCEWQKKRKRGDDEHAGLIVGYVLLV